MMNISCDDAEVMFVDQDDIIHLTHQVKNFSDALTKLKTVFTEGTSEYCTVYCFFISLLILFSTLSNLEPLDINKITNKYK